MKEIFGLYTWTFLSMVKRFAKDKQNKDKFSEYLFTDSGIIIGASGKEVPLMTTKEELKVYTARDEWEELIAQG